MAERLAEAARRMGQDIESPVGAADGAYCLRREQLAVFQDFARYLLDVTARPTSAGPAFCRIILPPRTGKTVIAGHILARSGLTATVIVPTRTLVEQTARVLRELLAGVPVGVVYGARRALVAEGVNVTTYAFLERCGIAGMPEPLRRAELVFADEAHHAMTSGRRRLLQEGFEPGAIRIALTATPDYDASRRLAFVFPDLVHEIDLTEAMELELLAPLRVWIAEVDEDASRVQLVAGDFEQETLGRLMSAAPFFRAAQVFRYGQPEAELPALIACASRQQAHDLHRYLVKHRPAGRPEPALILGDTPNAEREEVLARFERGEVDTLVQVGVLLEGWSSPQCKLLLDLAPTASRVRATQKSFRVMTRHGDAEARIYVLLPKQLPSEPVLPMDLFGEQEYVCGTRLGTKRSGGRRAPVETHERTLIDRVELKHRVVASSRFVKPALDKRNARQIRRVLESCRDFEPGCGVFQFRRLEFSHPLFTGRGDFLLMWLGVPATRVGLDAFLGRFYPEEIGSRILDEAGALEPERWGDEDVAHLEASLAEEAEALGQPSAERMACWMALGGMPAPMETPEEWLMAAEERARLHATVGQLKARSRALVVRRFGLEDGAEQTLRELGTSEGVCTARVGQMLKVSFRKLKFWLSRPRDEEVALARGLTPGLWRRAAGQMPGVLGGRLTRGRRDLDVPAGGQAAVRASGKREGAEGAERRSAALTVRSR